MKVAMIYNPVPVPLNDRAKKKIQLSFVDCDNCDPELIITKKGVQGFASKDHIIKVIMTLLTIYQAIEDE